MSASEPSANAVDPARPGQDPPAAAAEQVALRLAPKRALPRAVTGAIWLLALSMAAYFPAMRGGYIWDDDAYVTNNVNLRDLAGLSNIWLRPLSVPQYYPLVHSTFWIEYHLWGLDPRGYHMVNVVLHALGCLMLWLVLRRLKVPGAWVVAAVFAVHPVHVESVAWVTERKNVLSGLMYFLAMLMMLKALGIPGENPAESPAAGGQGGDNEEVLDATLDDEPASAGAGDAAAPRAAGGEGEAASSERGRWWHYLLALLFQSGALLSKTVTCSMPAALLLIIYWKRGRITRRQVWATVPFFVLGLAMGLVTAYLERVHVGAAGPEWDLSFFERGLVAGRALWFYAGKIVWPSNLTFIYPRWYIDATAWWQWLFPLGFLAVLALLWLGRKRLGRAPLTAVLFFAGTLFPALGFFNVYPMLFSFVADHFQYLASLGLIVLLVGGGAYWLERSGWGGPRGRMIAASVLVVSLLLQSWRQGFIYNDVEALWRDTVAKNPNCWMAQNNLACFYIDRNELDKGAFHAIEALKLRQSWDLFGNLAQARRKQGHRDEAIQLFRRALRLEPAFVNARINLAVLLNQSNRQAEAIAENDKILAMNPNSLIALINQVSILTSAENPKLRNLPRALELAEKACSISDNRSPQALSGLAKVHFAQGRYEPALAAAEQLVRLLDGSERFQDLLPGALDQVKKTKEALAGSKSLPSAVEGPSPAPAPPR